MSTGKTVSLVTAHVHKNIAKDVTAGIKDAGVLDFYMYAARSVVIDKKQGVWSMLPGRDLAEDPLETIFFLATHEAGPSLAHRIAELGHLYAPGRGSVLVEAVDLLEGHALCRENEVPGPYVPPPPGHLHTCTGICCIMQRGQGETVARIPLDTGTCVPAIHFGTGMGVRDKMGLLRITIPWEKEIVYTFTTLHEADNIMEMMIEAGRLERPGSGFIYTFPIEKGLVNIRVRRGQQQHAASIEQIVTTLDSIKGGTEWRRRRSLGSRRACREKQYIRNLVDMVLICDGGTGPDLMKAAMAAGAGGATISSVQYVRPADSPLGGIPPVRDACSMVVPESIAGAVYSALEAAGAFTDRCHGRVHVRKTYKAFTYIGG
ncbi:hypothetical protein [Desulfosudis oleivorans]|uniref:Uncharacterized protein n=1 Tax=Desulfosudis oleivorans (strain DSM 6200 / JCM 39069 / Hxd3) TaxID=96561 RepID=A8ZVJ4_DESOH|nr:hypothetical protein [Desulfosudis oleivorans]ABW68181.1 hypothetical protein Dole_2377 [Desulfosudis oleivorans Hxd3]